MKGAYGIMLIALGIFVSIMGGFILNAETVQTCSTEWEYVTDVSGAFQGDRSDMDVEYSPPSNITGWSYQQGYNGGWISGVDIVKYSQRANLYGAYSGAMGYSSYSLTVTSLTLDGNERPQRFSAAVQGGETVEADQTGGFGLNNGEIVTVPRIGAAASQAYGMFGAPLADVISAIPGMLDYSSVRITASGSNDGYPGFIVPTVSYTGTQGLPDRYYAGIAASVSASRQSSEVIVYPSDNTAMLDGQRVPAADVVLVWGHAKFSGTGQAVQDVTLSAVAETASERVFLDPAFGVLPIPGTYVTQQVVYTEHPTSLSPSLDIAIDPQGQDESSMQGTVSASGPGHSSTVLFTWDYVYGSAGRFYYDIKVGEDVHQAEASSRTGMISVSFDGEGTGTVTAGGQAVATVTFQDPISAFQVTSERLSSGREPAISYTATADDGSATSRTGIGAQELPVSWRTSTSTSTTHAYNSSWWSNGYQNSGVSIVFQSSGTSYVYTELAFYGPQDSAGTGAIVSCSSSGWHVEVDEQVASLGKWPAIEVSFGADRTVVTPLGSFTSFTDYSRVGVPVVIEAPAAGGGTIEDIEVWGDRLMPLEVVSTTTRIAEGGLYLQDAELDIPSAFPGLTSYSIVIGSAVHTGDAITFRSGSRTAQVQVSGDQALVGDSWVPLNGLTFLWYSALGPSASIGSHTYSPGIYDRGQVYDPGVLYAQTRNGTMTEVMEAPDGVSVTLDGIWAPQVSLYSGENVADERTELADFTKGKFLWDKNDFIICMMAVSVIGGIIGAYLGKATGADWLVIFGTIGILWLIL